MAAVLLAQANASVRAQLRRALDDAPEIELVTQVDQSEAVWRLLQEVRWDVLVSAGAFAQGPDAAEVLQRARAAGLAVRALILGTPDGDGLLCRLWRAGALGCIPEDAPASAIVAAVQAVAQGIPVWTPEEAAQAQRWWDEVGRRLEALTRREREVLALIAEGFTNRHIAERLVLSENTVETHVRNVLRKLQVARRLEAAMVYGREMLTSGESNITDSRDDR